MSIRRLFLFLLVAAVLVIAATIQTKSQDPDPQLGLIVGRNVNMVAGTEFPTYPDGDPYLQRQNEPSIAVSTRNPLHLLAGSNDYRAIDYVDPGELPGQDQIATSHERDAWLGVFKSFNGGQTWITTLLPGYKYNPNDPKTSPLLGFSASADPTVRAGPNGLFYYSGIAFDRIKNGRSVLFVARYTDNNTTLLGDPDTIKYIDTSIIDEGTSGQFADKPWIAVDIPRNLSPPVPIGGNNSEIPNQLIPAHNVYIVYSIFLGDLKSKPHNKILFARSTDCGDTWEHPTKLSEGEHINQGTTIAVSPLNGDIYIAWRRFKSDTETDAIMVCKSKDYGSSFTKPKEICTINPFDQFTGEERFRTSAFPTLAVDNTGIVYIAWSDRGFKGGQNAQHEQDAQDEYARIVISTLTDGTYWSDPKPIDIHIDFGHQIMPSLTFAAGKLMMTWYDTRNSDSNGEADIYGESQTMDVRVAQAIPSSNPSFTSTNPPVDSIQVSRYFYEVALENGEVKQPLELNQVQSNHPNYEMFVGGTYPFHGDYIDITSAPMFVFDVPLDNQNSDYQNNGHWRFNTGEDDWDPSTFHVTWTDNRDVIPPPVNLDWDDYQDPFPPCNNETTGMRNQNIYTAAITQGIMVGAPVNAKPLLAPQTPCLDPQDQPESFQQKVTFLVFVKNLTDFEKYFKLTLETPSDMEASFWEEGPPEVVGECPFVTCGDKEVDLLIYPHSSATLTVFVVPYDLADPNAPNPYATFRVKVEEVECNLVGNICNEKENGLKSYIILNPDPVNTATILPSCEYHTPTIITEYPEDVSYADPSILSHEIYDDPSLEELLSFGNPDIAAPTLRHPTLRHETIINPTLRHTALGSIPKGQVTDLRWRVTNNTDTTSAYSFEPIGENLPELPEGDPDQIHSQLLIYRVNTTPTSAPSHEPCALMEEEHHELLLKIDNPTLRHPTLRHPTLRHPTLRHNTFFLAPGETAICTLRIIDPDPPEPSGGSTQETGILSNGGTEDDFIPGDYATTVAGAAIPQASNPDGTIAFTTSLYIIAKDITGFWVNDYFEIYLEAYGGKPDSIQGENTPNPDDDVWKYVRWRKKLGEHLPDGLNLDSDGKIYGIPQYDPNGSYPKDYFFTVELEDESTPTRQFARRELKITIDCEFHPITVIAGEGGSICHLVTEGEECIIGSGQGSVHVPHGESITFAIKPITCFHVNDVKVDTVSKGSIESYTFTDVRKDYRIEASFAPNTYTITTIAGEGGSICHSVLEEEECISGTGEVNVTCGETKKFTVSVDEGYMLEDVIVGYVSKGPITTYTFTNITSDHRIETVFKELQKWVRRYNNKPVNGNDEANDIAVDPSSGNVYVTGYSLSRNKGKDFYTISYDGEGVESLSARYDGPAHMGDNANAIAVDASGNVYATGQSFRGMKDEHSDYCTVKYDSSDERVWDVRYDARRNGNDMATAIAFYKDETAGKSYVYVTGKSEDSLSKKSDIKHYDYYTIKYDAKTGRIERGWGARYNNAFANWHDEATAIAVDFSGNVYVTGFSSNGENEDNDIVTIKYDFDGNPVWDVWQYGAARYDSPGNGHDEASAIAVDHSGNVYVTGKSDGFEAGFDYITIKYHPNGTIDKDWGTAGVARYDGRHGDDAATDIAVHEENGLVYVYVTGYSSNITNNDYVTIKYGFDGRVVATWGVDGVVRYDGGNGDDAATAMAIDSAGNVYVTGESEGNGTGIDYYTIKYDSSFGNIVWQVRYDNDLLIGDDIATAIAVDSSGVYVTGRSKGINDQGIETGFDFATVKYEQ